MIYGLRRRFWLVPALAICSSFSAFPQASTGGVSGTVRDQSGAVIPGVAITLTKTDTNVQVRTASNGAGIYVFPGVVPGPYRLEAISPGMQTYQVTLTVQTQQSVTVDPVLKPGQTSTTVTVEDVTPMITSDNPTLGTVLEHARLETLPINGRDFTALMSAVPGMEGLRGYGERLGSAEVSLDGASINDRYRGATDVRPPGLDTIQEFKVENNASSAKFSRPTTVILTTKSGTNQFHGTLFEVIRNNAIGKARRREDTYSKAPFLNRNEYGGTIGGPVNLPKLYNGKNRTFFFFSYEGKRSVNPSTAGFNVPNEAMRKGDFSDLVLSNGQRYTLYDPYSTGSATQGYQREVMSYGGRANVIDPKRQSPLFKYLMSVTPLPTLPAVNPLWDYNYWGVNDSRVREYTTTSRIDHRFSDRDAFYARFNMGYSWNYVDSYGVPLSDGGANNILTTAPNKSLALSWVRSISPTFTNEVLATISRQYNRQDQLNQSTDFAGTLGLPNPFGSKNFPVINAMSFGNLKYQPVNPNASALTYFMLDDNMMKVAGKHEIEFGGHTRWDYLNTLGDQASLAGQFIPAANATGLWDTKGSLASPGSVTYTGYTLASAYMGLGNYMVRLNHNWFYGRGKEWAGYIQDKYRVTPRLVLFLGLRWEAWPAYKEKYNNISGFDPQQHAIVLTQPLQNYYAIGSLFQGVVKRYQELGVKYVDYKQAGLNQSLASSNWKDFAPRVGWAYRLGGSSRAAVLRGAVSLAYFPIPLRPWTEYARSSAPFTAYVYYNPDDSAQSPDGYGAWSLRNVPNVVAGVNSRNLIDPSAQANGMTRGATANFFDPNLPDTRQTAWNLTLEKEVLANTSLKVSYIGRHTDYLEEFNNMNVAPTDYTWYTTRGVAKPSGEFGSLSMKPYDQYAYSDVREYGKYGWGNYNGFQVEFQRRMHKGLSYQVFYNLNNAFMAGGDGYNIMTPPASAFMPGVVSQDFHERNKELNYARDTSIPRQRLSWNWLLDLPVGRSKWVGRNMGPKLDKVLGGWQLSGMGNVRTTNFWLPTSTWPTGEKVEIYGYKYPIQDCRSGRCTPGYLWWNGYINPNQINSYDANGNPNGVMGVPKDYKPAAQPINPWPVNPDKNNPMYRYYGSNTVFLTLKDGSQVTPTFDPGVHPWVTQTFPSTRTWDLRASLFKNVSLTEKVRLRFALDAFNVLNHPNNPSGIGGDGVLSTRSSSNNGRELQLSLRLLW